MAIVNEGRIDDIKKKLSILHQAADASENKIIFGLLSIKEHPISKSHGCSNQLVVVYDTGRFETLPMGVNGYKVKDYMGIRFIRVRMWGALPCPGKNNNPCGAPMESGTDIYVN